MGTLFTILIGIYVFFYHFKNGFKGFIPNVLGTFCIGGSINSILAGEFFGFLLFLVLGLVFYGIAPGRRRNKVIQA